MLRHLDLFSGIGGFSLGLEATGGFKTVAFCEIGEFPRKILRKHWSCVKQYTDIKELTYERLKADGIGLIDIVTGGYPCQPFSVAGRKKGEQDPRHLWPEMFRVIKECRPTWVIGENVAGHIKLGLDTVLENLESEGYSTRTFNISAASVGANHQRQRVWIVAHSECNDNQQKVEGVNGEEEKISGEHREDNSTTRKFSRTDSIRETYNRNVENTRQSIGGIKPSRNKKGARRGAFEETERSTNTDKTTRSSEGAETMADSATHGSLNESKRDAGSVEKEGERKKETGNQSSVCSSARSSNMANTQGIHVQGQHDGQGQKQSGGESWWSVEPDVGRVAHGIPKRVDRLKALGNSLIPQIPYYIGLAILESERK